MMYSGPSANFGISWQESAWDNRVTVDLEPYIREMNERLQGIEDRITIEKAVKVLGDLGYIVFKPGEFPGD